MNSTTEQFLLTAVKQQLAGNLELASKLYCKVLTVSPKNLTALVNQSVIYLELQNYADAAHLLQQALEISPKDVEALNNYGNALKELGQPDSSIEQFQLAHKLTPDNSIISSNLGRALLRKGDYETAIRIFESAIRTNPSNSGLRFINALALPTIPENLEQLEAARKRQSSLIYDLLEDNLKLSDPLTEIGMTNFIAAYQGYDDSELQKKLATCYSTACPELNYIAPHIGQKREPGRIRVGFVSAHLGSHTIGKLNQALILGLNKNKFEPHIFFLASNTQTKAYIIERFGHNIDKIFFPDQTLSSMRSTIAEAELDILYYPDIGMEPLSYFLGFSRLAAVQCVTWGHPVSTGISTIDYFISSQSTELPTSNAQYTEKLLRLKPFSTDYARPNIENSRKSREDFSLKDQTHLYMCPQSLFKFHPDFDRILGGILQADANGQIVLLEGQHQEWTTKLKTRFEKTIPEVSNRIKFLPRLSGSDFLQCIALADVILDTPYFCGGNTSYEAFALGKIIVTLPSKFLRSRLTLGLYKQMGINALIAESPKEYIKIAVKYGKNKLDRILIEDRIRKAQKFIFGTTSAIQAHEQFFLEVIRSDNSKIN
jgi:predicted O-linked N-acetylglucosamine transferase (SPINDLY family)